jgi:hypothetical protein
MHDLLNKTSHHTLFRGIFASRLNNGWMRVEVSSSCRGSEHDVWIKVSVARRVYIFRFVISRDLGHLEQDAQKGLEQLLTKHKLADLKNWSCTCIGVRAPNPTSNMKIQCIRHSYSWSKKLFEILLYSYSSNNSALIFIKYFFANTNINSSIPDDVVFYINQRKIQLWQSAFIF